MARLSLSANTRRHRAPGRPRWTRARLRARFLGAVYGLLTVSRVERPAEYDVWPDLFDGKAYRDGTPYRPGPLTVFGPSEPLHVCGSICQPDHPNHLHCFSEAYSGRYDVSQGA